MVGVFWFLVRLAARDAWLEASVAKRLKHTVAVLVPHGLNR